jgi:alpha,alpha-trehalase
LLGRLTTRSPLQSPADLFGELLHEVQVRRLFSDGKYFVDMEPRRHPSEIMSRFRRLRGRDDRTLAAFISEHFDAPPSVSPARHGGGAPPALLDHIRATWDVLVRQPQAVANFSSVLSLNAQYLVPGGRFRESYYWDSFFTMLGLRADGREDLIEATVENCTALIERFGFVPNGSRSYYLGRSQPPVYYLMLEVSPSVDFVVKKRRFDALLTEYLFWMADSESLRPGNASRRAVCMPDGSILNRYWDEFDRPRDESYAEDLITAQQSGRHPPTVFRNLRAAAESGWDFSSRWYIEGDGLGSTGTLSIVPIDLNCLLYGLEQSIARRAAELGAGGIALRFEHLARNRRHAIQTYCWSERELRFGDCLWSTGGMTSSINAAALFPLFAGVASEQQADAMASLTERALLAPGGIRTTTMQSGEQWDMPNGWAPLQWIAAKGLIRYGYLRLGRVIAHRWSSTVRREYEQFGLLFEKYDVEQQTPGRGGEYPVQTGFGWTNGVFRAFLADTARGVEAGDVIDDAGNPTQAIAET